MPLRVNLLFYQRYLTLCPFHCKPLFILLLPTLGRPTQVQFTPPITTFAKTWLINPILVTPSLVTPRPWLTNFSGTYQINLNPKGPRTNYHLSITGIFQCILFSNFLHVNLWLFSLVYLGVLNERCSSVRHFPVQWHLRSTSCRFHRHLLLH